MDVEERYAKSPAETRGKIAADLRQRVSDILFDIHSLAMDASNEPTRENIRLMQAKQDDLRRVLPDYYYSLAWEV